MKTTNNTLEEFRKRLSVIESELSGESISEQGFGKYDDDPIEDIRGYLNNIDELVKNQSKSETPSNDTLQMLADAYKLLAEKQIDKTTFKSIINDAFDEKKSEIKSEIKHDGYLNETDKQKIDNLSNTVTEFRKGVTVTTNLPEKTLTIIDNFNANIKILLTEGLGDKVEEKIKKTVNHYISSAGDKIRDIIRNESEDFTLPHKISHIASFIAGILIVVSIVTCQNASNKEEKAKDQMEKTKKEIQTSRRCYNFYRWVEDKYPDIVDEYCNLYANNNHSAQK